MSPPVEDSETAIVSLRSIRRRARAVAWAISSSVVGLVMASRDIVARSSRPEGKTLPKGEGHDRDVGEGAYQARAAQALPGGHRDRRARLGARRRGVLPLQP